MIFTKQMADAPPCENKDKWGTPAHIYNKLNAEFNFTLDPCCEPHTAKCEKFYTEQDNGLIQSWAGERVFVNPPYSRFNIDKWVKKCVEEIVSAEVAVGLLPVSSSAGWWHKYIIPYCEQRFVMRRIKFIGAPNAAPFSSIVVVFGSTGVKTFEQ